MAKVRRWLADEPDAAPPIRVFVWLDCRIGYHLFESIHGATFAAVGEVERSNLTVAPLYRRALGMADA